MPMMKSEPFFHKSMSKLKIISTEKLTKIYFFIAFWTFRHGEELVGSKS